MELKDYTTIQLLDELKRRFKAENPTDRKPTPKPEYITIVGKIVEIRHTDEAFYRWQFIVEFSDEDVEKYKITPLEVKNFKSRISLYSGKFKKGTAPKVGDKVLIRDRVSKFKTRFSLSSAKIIEIVNE